MTEERKKIVLKKFGFACLNNESATLSAISSKRNFHVHIFVFHIFFHASSVTSFQKIAFSMLASKKNAKTPIKSKRDCWFWAPKWKKLHPFFITMLCQGYETLFTRTFVYINGIIVYYFVFFPQFKTSHKSLEKLQCAGNQSFCPNYEKKKIEHIKLNFFFYHFLCLRCHSSTSRRIFSNRKIFINKIIMLFLMIFGFGMLFVYDCIISGFLE